MLTQTAPDRRHHYIVLSLIGGRTEELRALRWDHVHLDGELAHAPPLPPYVEVYRSVRAGGDTKTRRSRRTLALPTRCVEALRRQKAQQAADKFAAGECWPDTGLVFTTALGSAMERPMCGVTSGGRSPSSPVSTPPNGLRGNCGTRSSRSCQMPAYPWRRSPASSATQGRPLPSWSTGTAQAVVSTMAEVPM